MHTCQFWYCFLFNLVNITILRNGCWMSVVSNGTNAPPLITSSKWKIYKLISIVADWQIKIHIFCAMKSLANISSSVKTKYKYRLTACISFVIIFLTSLINHIHTNTQNYSIIADDLVETERWRDLQFWLLFVVQCPAKL